MGDITLKTPLDQGEAPFVWLATGMGPLVLSAVPFLIINLERNVHALSNRGMPVLATWRRSCLLYLLLVGAFWLLDCLSFWGARGGHLFVNRISVTVLYWTTLLFAAAWPWIYLLTQSYLLALVGLLLLLASSCCQTAWIFASETWWAGGVSAGSTLCVVAMAAAWLMPNGEEEQEQACASVAHFALAE